MASLAEEKTQGEQWQEQWQESAIITDDCKPVWENMGHSLRRRLISVVFETSEAFVVPVSQFRSIATDD